MRDDILAVDKDVKSGSKPASLIRSLVRLMSATVWAQIVNVLVTPLLAFLYGPHVFGVFLFTLSVAITAGAVTSARLEWAVALPKKESEARSITMTALSTAATVSTILLITILAVQPLLVSSYGSDIAQALVFVPALAFLISAISTLIQCSLRTHSFSQISQQTAVSATLTPLSQGGFSLITKLAPGLLVGAVLGRLTALLLLARANRQFLGVPRHGWATLRKYWRFPVLFAPSSLLNVLGTNLPMLVLATYFTASQAGQLGMAQRVILLPSAIVSTAVGQIYLARLTLAIREGRGDVYRQYLGVSRRLFFPGVAVAAGGWLLGPQVFSFVLGPEWAQAGEFMRAMAISVGLGFIVSPLTFVFVAFQRPWLTVAVDLSRIILVGGAAMIALSKQSSPTAVVWLMYVAQSVNYGVSWLVGLQIVRSRLRASTKLVGRVD